MNQQRPTLKQEDVIDILQSAFADSHDVIAVYLFGSMAAGTAHGLSDVDVAILLDESLDAEIMFQRTLAIGDLLERMLKISVDVVALNRAPTFLRFQIIQSGMLVVEHDRTQRCLFQMKAMNAYYDAKPFLDFQRNEAIRRIREQGLGHGHQGTHDALAEARRLRETLAVDTISAS